MESIQIIGQRLAEERKSDIDAAIDISESLDNCFFHAFALYYLANKLVLPRDLFSVYQHDNGLVRRLKGFFPFANSLQVFTDERLFEKTMILGVMFRSWFVAELLKDKENCKNLFAERQQNIDIASQSGLSFLTILKGYRRASRCRDRRAQLATQEAIYKDVPLFQANAKYIRNFSGSIEKNYNQIKVYWYSQGYSRYCYYLARPGIKIFHEEISPVLRKLNIPYVIYSKTSITVVTANRSFTKNPDFELAIEPMAAHYHLLLSEKTQPLLLEYQKQRIRYKKERESILANESADKVALCEDNPNWFLAAVLPPGSTGNYSSLELLFRSVKQHITRDEPTSYRLPSLRSFAPSRNTFQADSPIVRRKKIIPVSPRNPIPEFSLPADNPIPERVPSPSAEESVSYSFNLKIFLSIATTIAGAVLVIAGIILTNPILLSIGATAGLGGLMSLCFFSYKSTQEEELSKAVVKDENRIPNI